MDLVNAQTILRYGAIPAFLRPMPFQKIRNLGGKLGTAVKETYEANTVGDLLYVRGRTFSRALPSPRSRALRLGCLPDVTHAALTVTTRCQN